MKTGRFWTTISAMRHSHLHTFSVLVGVDFLDAEAFMDAGKSLWRVSEQPLTALVEALDRTLAMVGKPGRINELRARILVHCRAKASLKPGLFTLTAPAGGGKILTSMAFALNHPLLPLD